MLRPLKIVVVPDSSAAQQVPAVDGLLEYRKDKQELYVRSNETWNVLALESKVGLLKLLQMEVKMKVKSTEYKINRRSTRVETFEVCVRTHVALRMVIMQVLTSQLFFLANRNAELAAPLLFWPVNKNRGTCCTAEWPYCLFFILRLRVTHIRVELS